MKLVMFDLDGTLLSNMHGISEGNGLIITQDVNGVFDETIGEIKSQIDGKIECWYQTTSPSTAWSLAEKPKHVGDMWFNTSSKELKYYNTAFCHSSYVNENHLKSDYERLEFLGDAVLGLLVAKYIYETYPIKDKLFPFVSLSLGYTAACHSSINWKISNETESGTLYTPTTSYENFKQKLQGGFYCDFGAGLKIGMVNFSVGLQHQRLNIIEQYSNTIVSYDYKADSNNYEKSVVNDEEIKLKTKINSFYIKVGINF